MTVQAAVERVLAGGMTLMNAKGAAAVLMDVRSGEVISIASLPDFDPNSRPLPPTQGSPSDSPIFNRAVQGVYELGSTFKIFAAAQAMDLGLVTPQTVVDTSPPMKVGGFRIGEFHNKNYGVLSVEEIIINSSNRGTAKLAHADRRRPGSRSSSRASASSSRHRSRSPRPRAASRSCPRSGPSCRR